MAELESQVGATLKYIRAFIYRNWRFWGPIVGDRLYSELCGKQGPSRLHRGAIETEWLASETTRWNGRWHAAPLASMTRKMLYFLTELRICVRVEWLWPENVTFFSTHIPWNCDLQRIEEIWVGTCYFQY